MRDLNCVCLVPWLHRFTNEQGLHQVCCVGVGETNTLHDASGGPLHISQALTDAQVLNSPDLKAIRTGMLRGKWPAACLRCRQAEETGACSVRQGYEYRFGRWKSEVIAQTSTDGTLAQPVVRYADLRFANGCNLTCRMCGPGASRPWVEHYNAVQPPGHALPEALLATMRNDNWVKRQPVRWLLEQCLPTVEALNFAGGEIDLAYNTNLTLLPDKVTRLWSEFREVSLIVSVMASAR